MASILFIALLVGVAYFINKKFNGQRRKRANKFNDDEIDYSSPN